MKIIIFLLSIFALAAVSGRKPVANDRRRSRKLRGMGMGMAMTMAGKTIVMANNDREEATCLPSGERCGHGMSRFPNCNSCCHNYITERHETRFYQSTSYVCRHDSFSEETCLPADRACSHGMTMSRLPNCNSCCHGFIAESRRRPRQCYCFDERSTARPTASPTIAMTSPSMVMSTGRFFGRTSSAGPRGGGMHRRQVRETASASAAASTALLAEEKGTKPQAKGEQTIVTKTKQQEEQEYKEGWAEEPQD